MGLPIKVSNEVKRELNSLDALPELKGDRFPVNGHRDFRTFAPEDYENFSAGVFVKSDDPKQGKWFGGAKRAPVAKAKLEELGYLVTIPTEHQHAEAGGYRWTVLLFTPICMEGK